MTQPSPLLSTSNLPSNHDKALSFYRANSANEMYLYIKALYCSLMSIIHQTEHTNAFTKDIHNVSQTHTHLFFISLIGQSIDCHWFLYYANDICCHVNLYHHAFLFSLGHYLICFQAVANLIESPKERTENDL